MDSAKAVLNKAKLERIIEAVRHGLEGDAAVEFIHRSGYAMTSAGIARNLRAMGGRRRVQDLIAEGKSTVDILKSVFPEDDFSEFDRIPPSQQELFGEGSAPAGASLVPGTNLPLYETTKLTLRVPNDLFEAIRLAAKLENKTQNQLIVDILTSALSQMPGHARQE